MTFESVLRTDLLSEDLLESPEKVRMVAETQYNIIVPERPDPTRTPMPAKDIIDAMNMVKMLFENRQTAENKNKDAKLSVFYGYPESVVDTECISMEITRREPSTFGKGAPFENSTRQLKPILRQETEDPDNPGYKRAVLGYCYDNILELTCWARTNKVANERALWVEDVVELDMWFIIYSGVNRMLYQGRGKSKQVEIDGNKFYGIPIQYFVRTERLRNISVKKLEEILITYSLSSSSS